MPTGDGGLGEALVGEKMMVNQRQVAVTKLLGEGGFSYVYLVKEISDVTAGLNNTVHGDNVSRSNSGSTGRSGSFGNGTARRQGSIGRDAKKEDMVLKVTSILSRQQRDIAEKEAKLLSRLSHPSIIKMYDTCYRTVQSGKSSKRGDDKNKERPQHLILMELCDGGHALEVCTQLAQAGERFDLSTLIIAFGQICNAVSYLHAQRPPIVHRDLKPANFLVKNGAYKLCDFGSAVFGHVELKTPQQRMEAEEVIEKTTTQMFRAPEMVDLHMAKKLTQATDVWALGACLYSMAFLQNCFEEGSNLAILNRKYKIPDDNPYGEGLVELLDRMLTVDSKARADMTEIILCLSAVYSGRSLPPRKERSSKSSSSSKKDKEKESSSSSKSKKKKNERAGTFRTDGQGISQEEDLTLESAEVAKTKTATKLNPNSAAFRRRQAAAAEMAASSHSQGVGSAEFGTLKADNFFESADTDDTAGDNALTFGSFDAKAADDDGDGAAAFGDTGANQEWGNLSEKDVFASFDPETVSNLENAFGGGTTTAESNEGDDETPVEETPVEGGSKGRTRSAPRRRTSGKSSRGRQSSSNSADAGPSPGMSSHSRRRSRSKSRDRRRASGGRSKDDDEAGDKDAGEEATLENLRSSLASSDDSSKPKGERRRSSRHTPSRNTSTRDSLNSTSRSREERGGVRRSRSGAIGAGRRDSSDDAAKRISASALSFE